jgi:5-methylcytosine-specific restriction protein A
VKRSGPPQRRTPMPRSKTARGAGKVPSLPPKRRKRNTGPSASVRDDIHARDKCCQAHVHGFGLDVRCGGGLQIHHKLPRGMGGTSDPTINDPANLVLLCQTHHAQVESNRSEAYAADLLTRRGTQ